MNPPILGIFIETFLICTQFAHLDGTSRSPAVGHWGCVITFSISSHAHGIFPAFLLENQNDQEQKDEIQTEQKIIFFFWFNFPFDLVSYFSLLDYDRKFDLSDVFNSSLYSSVLGEEMEDSIL